MQKNIWIRTPFAVGLFIVLAIWLFLSTSAKADVPATPPIGHTTLAPMLKKTMPAIVNLLIQGEAPIAAIDPFANKPSRSDHTQHAPHDTPPNSPSPDENDNKKFIAAGSGVIIDAQKGLIVTNAHVVDQAKSILVTLSDGRRFLAKPVGQDTSHDIALLAIKASHLTALTLADSNQLNIGDYVAAIGSPFNLKQTVTSGIISALHRNDIGIEGFENFIQTDAPINPGNSGGALVNMSGQLIGINTAIITPSNGGNVGIGLAIPSNVVKIVVSQLLKYGKIQRGMLGVQIQTLTPNLATAFDLSDQQGAIVTYVSPYSAADKAGLLTGDIIIAANGDPIHNAAEVKSAVGLLRVDTKLKLTLIRHQKTLHKTAIIAEKNRATELLREHHPFLYGVTTCDIRLMNPALGQVSGVRVLGVDYDSPAWISSLRERDIIVAVNTLPIHNTTEFMQAVEKNQHEELLLTVLRDDGYFFIVIH